MTSKKTSEPSCHAETGCAGESKGRPDWLLLGSGAIVVLMYLSRLILGDADFQPDWFRHLGHAVHELVKTMWWGVLLGILMLSLLTRIPRSFVMSVLGSKHGYRGVIRATIAGVMLDLCTHGILMVGAKLYERGASIGQVMAFLIASPWNSFSLTLVLVAMIGLKWTLLFVISSMVIAVVTGILFDWLVDAQKLPANPNQEALDPNFKFWHEAKTGLRGVPYSLAYFAGMFRQGLLESRMVMRWLLFGIVLASLVRTFVPAEVFSSYFGPTLLGLGLTLLAATIMEVCSEGSAPIAGDLLNRANAPGNGFAFLMAGASTDYTEVMVIRETTQSWKIALFLPLLTIPQVIVFAVVMNGAM